MTAPAHPSRLRAVARLLLLVAAIGLTTWGVCLIAFAGTMRGTRLGIPIAFWGVLLGYTAIRTNGHKTGAAQFDPSDPAITPSGQSAASAELVRERDEARRYEYELRLEAMLRRELEQVLRTELAGLRSDVTDLGDDVAQLRSDVLDGRLQMEHVEITRITGANLAALQDDGRIAVRAAAADVTLTGAGESADWGLRREDAASVLNGHGFDGVPSTVADAAADGRPPVRADGFGSRPGSWRDPARGGVLEPGPGASSGPIATLAAVAPPTSATGAAARSPLSEPATPAATIPPSAALVSTPSLPAPSLLAPSPPARSVSAQALPAQALPAQSRPAPWAPAASSAPASSASSASASSASASSASASSAPASSPPASRASASSAPTWSVPASSVPASSAPAGPQPVAWAGPAPSTPPVPDRSPDVEAAPLTEPASEPRPEPADRSGPDLGAAPDAPQSDDPFASLPRLSAFRLPDLPAGMTLSKPILTPAEPEPAQPSPAVPETSAAPPTAPVAGYVGRRRQAGADTDDEHAESPRGRHGDGSGSDSSSARPTGSGGSTRPVAHRR